MVSGVLIRGGSLFSPVQLTNNLFFYSSMIEMSTYQNYRNFPTNFQAEVNPGAPELLAQLFWTGASVLESDYPGEYTMAMKLLSKV